MAPPIRPQVGGSEVSTDSGSIHPARLTLAFVALPRQDQIATLDTASDLSDGHLFAAMHTPAIAQQALTGFAGNALPPRERLRGEIDRRHGLLSSKLSRDKESFRCEDFFCLVIYPIKSSQT